jgi:hypothetical protein
MTIICTEVKGRDLQPGDLFSTRGQAYWDLIDRRKSVGESVYIRTRIPAEEFPDGDETVFKIEVQR